jgi:hypothetical protein
MGRSCGGAADPFFAKLIRKGELAFGFSAGLPDLVPHDPLAVGASIGRRIEKFFNGHVDFADVFVSQGSLADKLEVEHKAVHLQSRLVDGEFHREIPRGIGAPLVILRCLGLLLLAFIPAGDRNDGVDVHLGNEVELVQIHGGLESDIQSSILHF